MGHGAIAGTGASSPASLSKLDKAFNLFPVADFFVIRSIPPRAVKVINLVFTCKLLRSVVYTQLSRQVVSQFLHNYYLPRYRLRNSIKAHIFVHV